VRIGFSAIYSWRPHIEQMVFLANLAEKAGHQALFLTCDADLPTCYTREFRSRSGIRECIQCRLSGIRSYRTKNVASIGQYRDSSVELNGAALEWANSSASTLGRFESSEDFASGEFKTLRDRLVPAVQMAYTAARAWMVKNQVDAVCVFNGRMDATRAIFEAARSLDIRVVSVERALFGEGLQLFPDENCLGLHAVNAMVTKWRDRPLTMRQALAAAAPIARRFMRVNDNEWRAYNRNASEMPWPITNATKRILLVPSSRNETWGHPDWRSGWGDITEAYDALIAHLQLSPTDLVLRCHPNWSEMIGKQDGHLSQIHYASWAAERGILCISSSDSVSTLGLIEQCDVTVVANGSAALEAGLLGKQVVGLTPSSYQKAGFRDSACNPLELRTVQLRESLAADQSDSLARNSARYTLRFCYTMAGRLPQYTDAVVASTITSYRFDPEARPDIFLEMLRTGKLQAYDQDYSPDTADEDRVLEFVRQKDWPKILELSKTQTFNFPTIKRRMLYRPVDFASRTMPVGDR
jgi:hypothetical protein